MNSPIRFERYRSIIDDWEGFQDALRRPLPTCVWANPLKTTPAELEDHLRAQKIDFEPLAWKVGAYRLRDLARPGTRLAYIAGLLQTQEEVSMVPVELLDLQPGHRVLDACAAPGSKTTQIGAKLGISGTVIANDRDFRRLRALARSLDRLGIVNTAVLNADATNLPEEIGSFDRVLADVPCSCEGTSRKNLEITAATPEDFTSRATIQQAILKRCVELCRPGGRVVYSTCTYAPEENEAIVDAVLEQFGDLVQLLPARLQGLDGTAGLARWGKREFSPQLKHALRIYPHHNDTGGFFVAVLKKRED